MKGSSSQGCEGVLLDPGPEMTEICITTDKSKVPHSDEDEVG